MPLALLTWALVAHALPRLDAVTTERRIAFVRAHAECAPLENSIDFGPPDGDGGRRALWACRTAGKVRSVEAHLVEDASGRLTLVAGPNEGGPEHRLTFERRLAFVTKNLNMLTECTPIAGTVDLTPMSVDPEIFTTMRVTFSCTLDGRAYFGEARLGTSERYELEWIHLFYPDPILGESLPRGYKLVPRTGA